MTLYPSLDRGAIADSSNAFVGASVLCGMPRTPILEHREYVAYNDCFSHFGCGDQRANIQPGTTEYLCLDTRDAL
jgi:hypothetical protein